MISASVILLLPGCGLWNWDVQKKTAESKGPGVSVRGENLEASWDADGSVYVHSHGNAEAEIRRGNYAKATGFNSDFDGVRFGSQKDVETEAISDISGKAGASGTQEPSGLTLQEILLAVAAVVVLPLVAGFVLVLIPATKPIGTAILSIYGKLFGFILNRFKKKEIKDVENT